jgi:ATP-dependent helicase HrpA
MSRPVTSTQPAASPADDFLSRCLLADREKLVRLAGKLSSLQRTGKPSDRTQAELDAALKAAQGRIDARAAKRPTPTFPDDLPIAERRDDIAKLVREHQVVIVCGETGSGKTTQLPKICLDLGLGTRGLIGCTQPRRIAARSLASRLAFELKAPQAVGFKIRFQDHTHPDACVKVMTDGILLAETHGDRDLLQYDTLIIDEAHERSLNIDFLLGYLKRLLPRRPDLKVIVTSATIDPQRFARHFTINGKPAPVIEVSGRTYPVEIRYHPEYLQSEEGEALDLADGVLKAVDELTHAHESGDVLVFLPGEREIRDCAEALRKHHPDHTEVLPLYARLSSAEQDRIFSTGGRRRIVLSTNVAETSLTVPGIRYVVDSGLARINRYSPRSKINLLQIEKISQASARQRAGRCGRVAAGIAIRLYSEEDHDDRSPFTTPEILRTSLASVILRMKALGLGDVSEFPFLEAPSPRMIEDGYRLLFELGAVDAEKSLTRLGHELAKLPIDPRIGRMLLAAKATGCLSELLIICSALSVQDPRVRPHDKQQEATLKHEQWADPQSDFLAWIKLWNWYEEQLKHRKSNRKFTQEVIANFLSPLRMREWRDIHGQLAELMTEQGGKLNGEPAHYDILHRALLTGLLANVGTKAPEGDHYLGVRAIQFRLPGQGAQHAAQKRTRMKWIMAGEITETTRIFARTVARIEPEWIEDLGAHLVTRTHFDAHWDRKTAQVVAYEQVALYGLIVQPRKRVHFGSINPKDSREIFIRQGLVTGEFDTHGKFLLANRKLVAEIQDLEHKARRQDVLIDDDAMYELYDAIIPADIVNGAGFEKWRKDAERQNPNVLLFTRETLMRRAASEITVELFPKSLKHRAGVYPIKYRFEPGHVMDGLTLTLPVSVLNQVEPHRFEWLVPGMLRDKVAALIKTLPQRFRSQFVPIPETVSAFMEWLWRHDGMRDLSRAERPLNEMLAGFLSQHRRATVSATDFDLTRVPPHLFANIRIIDADGAELAMGRDFTLLKEQFADASRTMFSTLHRNTLERDGVVRWDFGDLPEEINFERNSVRYNGYPALVDAGTSANIRIMDDKEESLRSHRTGLVRLLILELSEQARVIQRGLKPSANAGFQYSMLSNPPEPNAMDSLKAEIMAAAVAETFLADALPREQADFHKRRDTKKSNLAANAQRVLALMDESFLLLANIRKSLDDRFLKTWEHVEPDIRSQLDLLFWKGFIAATPFAQLQHYPRYLKAVELRITKMKQGAMERDIERLKELKPLWQNLLNMKNKLSPAAQQYRWMVEELRVSLFAQELRTPMPVSVKRVAKAWEELV